MQTYLDNPDGLVVSIGAWHKVVVDIQILCHEEGRFIGELGSVTLFPIRRPLPGF